MTSNTNFLLTALDPDTNKANFITWLGSQAQYTDYNFLGSNWNVLLDVLSRNTFKNAYYLNMIFSEMFIDSAQLKESVVSRAKELNYTPYSRTSASTFLNLNIQTGNLTFFVIPKGTGFSGTNEKGSFIFRTNEVISQNSSNGYFSFSNVGVYEGNYTNDLFTMDYSATNQIFTLSNHFIDLSSLTVTVTEENGSVINQFSQATDIFNLNGNSQIYFTQATSNNRYQFLFGDGILGYRPQNGAIIQANYRNTFGPRANGISTFTLNDNLAAFNNGTITTIKITPVSNSGGGSYEEGIESIRFNAPRAYQTLDRAVTSQDYKTLILNNFPNVVADAAIYSGGISASNVQFGTVIISCVSPSGNPITQSSKDQISSYLSNLDIIHVSTEFIDANTLYIGVTSNVHVDFSTSNISIGQAKSMVVNAIANYSNSYLQGYRLDLRFSQLTANIDSVDDSIISNETSLILQKQTPIIINTNTNIVINFNNPIEHVNSDAFSVNGVTNYLSDQSRPSDPDFVNGSVFIISLNPNNKIITANVIGSVNYTTGYVNIPRLSISQFLNNQTYLNFYAIPQNQDIYAVNNDIIKISTLMSNVSISNG